MENHQGLAITKFSRYKAMTNGHYQNGYTIIAPHHPNDWMHVRAYIRPGHPNQLIVEYPKIGYMQRVQLPLLHKALQSGLSMNSDVFYEEADLQYNNR